MNDWALITGASSGIGLELAKLFAADKFNLVLLARNATRLNALAADLKSAHGIQTRALVQDLAEPDAARKISSAVAGTPISVLVNNAGFGFYGEFAQSDLNAQTEMMQVNMIALVQLTRLFLDPMRTRNSGRILNVASTAAFQPGPMVNVYYASKAFVHSFSYALAEELNGSGITVTALCPGTTHTEFFERGNFGPTRAPFTMDAHTVAEIGYRGMLRGKRVVIPGWTNWLGAALARRLPVRWTTAVVRRVHQKKRE